MHKLSKLTILLFIVSSCDVSVKKTSKTRNEIKNTVHSNVVIPEKEVRKTSIFELPPMDESGSDKTLIRFIRALKLAVKKKNTTELLNMIDDSIVVSYGGGLYGKNVFINEWGLNDPKNDRLWICMNQLLRFGGAWDNDEEFGEHFVIPYYQSDKILGKIDYPFDWYKTFIANSANVKVYKSESLNGAILDSLNYSLLERISITSNSDFQKIKILETNAVGYVLTSQINLLSEPAIILNKKGGSWKIVAFAGYD